MRSFLSLVGFEYKKIFKRKSAVATVFIVALVIFFAPFTIFFGSNYMGGHPFESRYDAVAKDRSYALALSGRAMDEQLFKEAIDAYSNIPAGVMRYADTPEYHQYARPYSSIYWYIYGIYRPLGNTSDIESGEVMDFTEEELRQFYQLRHEAVVNNIEYMLISNVAKETLIRLDNELDTPFIFAHTNGFNSLINWLYAIGIVCAFALAVCIAPVFAGEYGTRTDQIILSSKFGKSKLISAKLFTAVSFTIIFFLFLLLLSAIINMLIFGYGGASAPLQLIIRTSPYPLTILKSLMIYAACVLCGN
jgi:ABC-type transport system involved in multi-copper enzyme maturation permease subunit